MAYIWGYLGIFHVSSRFTILIPGGLIPWAWIEASTKGAVLLFTSSEVEQYAQTMGMGKAMAGIVGGMTGGVAQAYTTMGIGVIDLGMLLID